MRKINRRRFVKNTLLAAGGVFLGDIWPLAANVSAQAEGLADIAVATGTNAQINVYKALEALGGIKRFVREGARVVIKPNIAWNRTPQQAGNTNPEVVAALVRLCKEAKAGHISVWDNTCHNPKDTYERSGIAAAAAAAGAAVHYVNPADFVRVKIPEGKFLREVDVYRAIRECDVFINVPIAKVHGLSALTLGMKNLMGVIKDRPALHEQIHEKLPELHTVVRPHLTVLDATRILTAHGPQGGNLDDVVAMNQIIASTDLVGVDAYGSTLFNIDPRAIGFIAKAHEMKLGDMRLPRARIIPC